jgi:predicted Zn-dependent peptidase
VLDLPEDVYATYVQQVSAVTPAEASKAMMARVQPAKFLVVVVGDREKVEAPLRALGLGPVRVMTVEQALK